MSSGTGRRQGRAGPVASWSLLNYLLLKTMSSLCPQRPDFSHNCSSAQIWPKKKKKKCRLITIWSHILRVSTKSKAREAECGKQRTGKRRGCVTWMCWGVHISGDYLIDASDPISQKERQRLKEPLLIVLCSWLLSPRPGISAFVFCTLKTGLGRELKSVIRSEVWQKGISRMQLECGQTWELVWKIAFASLWGHE